MEIQKISKLTPRQGNVNVTGVIKEKAQARIFNKYGRELKVCDALLADDSGSIKLTLWNDDVGKYNEGDKVKVINGYVNEFQGEKQLTSGKFGKIEKLESGDKDVDEVVDVLDEEVDETESDEGLGSSDTKDSEKDSEESSSDESEKEPVFSDEELI